METYIPISFLNDFIFCPRSIYFHQLYGRTNENIYHTTAQSEGKMAHKSIDNKTYTTSKKVLQTIEIYSSRFGLGGKIDQSTCYKLFALFIVGHISITSGLLQRSKKFGFSITMFSYGLIPYGTWQYKTEGNFLLRQKHGYRLQYSIFQIKNSKRVLALVSSEIKNNFEKKFTQTDSIMIFNLSENCKITKYGYAKNDDDTLIVI